MAIGIQNYPNITGPESDFPNGSIKDDTGLNDGTPVNKEVYNDIHQFFAKLLRLAAITPTNQFESEYNGFQYVEAMRVLFKQFPAYTPWSGLGAALFPTGESDILIVFEAGSPAGRTVFLPGSTYDDTIDGCTVTVVNKSSNSLAVARTGSDTIDFGTAGVTVNSGSTERFFLDKSGGTSVLGPNWIKL